MFARFCLVAALAAVALSDVIKDVPLPDGVTYYEVGATQGEALNRQRRQNVQVNTGDHATQIMRHRRQNVQVNTGNGATQIMGRKRREAPTKTAPEIAVDTPNLNAHVGPSGIELDAQKPAGSPRDRRQNIQINTGNGATQIQGRKRREIELELEEERPGNLQRERRQNVQINTGNHATQIQGRKRREVDQIELVLEEERPGNLQRERRQNIQINTGNHATQVQGRKRREVDQIELELEEERSENLQRERRQNIQINTGNHATQIQGRKRREVGLELEEERLENLSRDRRQNIQINTGNHATQVQGRKRRNSPPTFGPPPPLGSQTSGLHVSVGPEGINLAHSGPTLDRHRRQNVQVNTGNGATQIMGRKRREIEDVEDFLVREKRQNVQINTGNHATQIQGRRRRESPTTSQPPTPIGVLTPGLQASVGPEGINLAHSGTTLDRHRRQNVQVNTGNGATQIMGRKRREIEDVEDFLVREKRQNVQVNTGNHATQIQGRRRRESPTTSQPLTPIGLLTPGLQASVGPEGINIAHSGTTLDRHRRQNVQVNTGNGATQIMGRKRREIEDVEDVLVREKRQNVQINTGNHATQIQGRRRRESPTTSQPPTPIGVLTPGLQASVGPEGINIAHSGTTLDRHRRQNVQINTGNGATQIMGGRKRRSTVDVDTGNVYAHVSPSHVYANVQRPQPPSFL